MKPVNVLVVEDNASTAIDLKKQLEKIGYQVPSIADSGEEAIKAARSLKPDVILMDTKLSGKIDGVQAAQEIAGFYDVPIIFITAHHDPESYLRAKSSKPYAFIAKPYEIRDVNNAIEIALFKHKAESMVSVAERRYQAIMRNASCGIFIHDVNGVISDVNIAAEKIFGCSRKELIDQDFRQFVIKSDQSYAQTMLQKLLIEKKIGPNLGHIQQPGGNIVDVEFSAIYVEYENENFMLSILTDITERNRMRSQAQLSDKLATVGALSAGIIHEINNPLTWVLTNLAYLKDKVNKLHIDNTAQKSSLMEIIDESIQGSERIKGLVRDLKGFARIDSDKVTLVDIRKSLENAIKMANTQCKNRAEIVFNYADDIPLLLMANSKLEQVFLNLIVNAAQAMDDTDTSKNIITISAIKKSDNNICVIFSDTGKGISPDVLPRIFEPFYTTKPVGVGTGLGLSICYDIVHNAGGQITVESELGSGAKFTVCLPVQFKALSAEEPDIQAITILGRKRILAVDDEPTLVLVIQRMLEKHHDITISNGRKALDLLVNHADSFDAIITDLNMPDVNGIDLYRYVSKNHIELAKHMIFTTGGETTPVMDAFIKDVKNPCLEKPFTINQLIQAIKQIFSK